MHLEEVARRRAAWHSSVIGARKISPSVRGATVSIVVLVAGIVWALCVPYTVSAQTGFNGPGPYEIANSQPGKVFDLDWRDGTSAIRLPSQGTAHQRWALGPADWDRNSSGNSTTVTCSSDNGWRVHCNADTRNGVRLARQISGARCDQGSTWGYDSTGVWVDQGCRAVFDLAGGGSTINSNIIACSSVNGRRVYCDADTSRGVRLVRQIGASPCDQGSGWGHDWRGVWVDRGCSAEFDVSGRILFEQTRTIAAGTSITVRNNEPIDARQTDGRSFSAVVDQDVLDAQGNVAIPRGSDAELMVRTDSNDDLALDLQSVTVNGQRYALTAHSDRLADGQKDGIGQNKRTAEYLGGGALLGTIIGAIAGGGKGAAIGAAAGAAAGAGTQVLTRGKAVNVPTESLLTFRLERTLEMGVADGDFNRDGRPYFDPNR